MHAWSGEGTPPTDGMGPSVTRAGSARPTSEPLKNGNELREAGYLIAVGSRTARFRRKHKHKLLFILLIALVLLLLCLFIVMTVLYVRQKKIKPIRICESKECLRSAANLALSMDRTADPCQEFYQYTCGNWAEEHPRPDSLQSYDWFRDKQSRVYALVRDALTRNDSHIPGPVHSAREMYDACIDIETLDKRGLKPILPILESLGLPPYPTFINVTEDFDYSTFTFDWLATIIKIRSQLGMDVLVGFDIFTDPKNSSIYRLVMGSPETTNPFPSMHNERKRHSGKRNLHKTNFDESFIRYPKRHSNSEDEHDERKAQVYKLFYAELMKLFVLESGAQKDSKLSEAELDSNILMTATEYFNFNNNIYDLESENDTDTDTNDETYLNVPEYTAMELQKLTDIALQVESENVATDMAPVWSKYLEGVFSVSDVKLDFETDKILVSELDLKYLVMMTSMVVRTPPVTLQLYVWMKVVEVMAIHTTSEVRLLVSRARKEARKQGGGESEPSARSLHCANAVNEMLGMAVAYAIADPHFLNVTKPKIQTMLHELKNALAQLVGKTRWMDDDTKVATYQKIVQMKTLVGFPDWLLKDGALEAYYKGIEVNPSTHLENMINIIQFKIKIALNRFRERNNFYWATDPTEVNAYHTFQENTISDLGRHLDAAVPLVMLQYPFFDLGLDSLNYGSLGTILGHEITHGFDNFGRMFDKNGNLVAWWSNETIAAFINMTHCFVDQYNTYYVQQVGEHVDGKKTLGENIADNGGVREALAALHRQLRRTGPEPKLPGFEHMTSDQLFFLSYGNLWCGVWTQESLEMDLEDEHAPQKFRAEGALRNTPEFARAWHCPPGTPMNPPPDQRCVIF